MIEYENLHRLNKPFREEFLHAFNHMMEEGQFILGSQVTMFEQEFAAYCGARHCVGVGNGLDALTLALRSFSFKEGSEVIVPSNTYIATILAIINSGLKPILVEPDISTYNLDPRLLEKAISPKCVAMVAVHLYGKCCPMDEILGIAGKHRLKVIEDCAHAHGATLHGKAAGTYGDLGAFSFYPTKNLGALGDGGCLLIKDEDLNVRIRSLRNYGSSEKNVHTIAGYNSRLDEIQAGFLRIKLKTLNALNDKRRLLASIYQKNLNPRFIKPSVDEHTADVHYVFNVRHPKRDHLKKHLAAMGIETQIHYPIPPHRQQALKGLFGSATFPISEEIHATTLSLPISPIHSEEEIMRVIEGMNVFN